MGIYYDIVKANGRNADDKTMWASVAMVDDLLEKMKEHHADIYETFIKQTIGLYYKGHFEQTLGQMEVAKMYHYESKGGQKHKIQGEHYDLTFAQKVKNEYREIPLNEWDWYVLLNMAYHDNICMLMEWFPSEESYNNKVIDCAVNFIDDDDADDTKLWDYLMK